MRDLRSSWVNDWPSISQIMDGRAMNSVLQFVISMIVVRCFCTLREEWGHHGTCHRVKVKFAGLGENWK